MVNRLPQEKNRLPEVSFDSMTTSDATLSVFGCDEEDGFSSRGEEEEARLDAGSIDSVDRTLYRFLFIPLMPFLEEDDDMVFG